MANRQNTLLLKRSNVIGKIPPISGLTLGEMALNTADAKLYSLYTSGTVSPTEVRQIGWDRISRTGDTLTGDFNIFGDVAISGSVLPNGYALTVTGDTDILGDLCVEGNIDYDGNLVVSGSAVFQSGITANTIYTDYIDFNTGATVPQSVGRVSWDSGTGTLNVAVGDGDTGLIDLQVGQEEIVRVFNDEATTLVKGEIVYVSGSNGNRPRVKRSVAISDGYSVTTLGMVSRNIASGDEGYVTTFGIISNLNTLGLSGGTPIWLSGTVPGAYTSTKPIAPKHIVLIGYVVRVSATVGSVFVNISNGWELDELHDVRISGVTEGDLLIRSSYSGTPVWVNSKTLKGNYTFSGNTNQIGNFNITGNTNQIGNFTITGNTFQSGNTEQIGNFNLTGNTEQIGNFTITGNTIQSGNTTQTGNFHITGNTSQLGDSTQTGNVTLSGNTFITGDTTQSGTTFQNGNFNITGNTNQIGDFTITGNTTQSGSTTQVGNYNVTGNTNQLGYNYIVSADTGCTLAVTGTTCLTGPVNITGPTFMSGNFCMNNMNTGQTGTNCLDTSLIPTGATIIHQFQSEGGVFAHLGDLASGEPNSRGYTYFENNTVLTSFVASGTGVYTPVIGAPQTVAGYANLFIVTTGATTATTNKLTYNYPPASGTSFTFLKFTVSLSVELSQNQQLTFQIRRTRGVSVTTIPIGMSITPNGNTANGISFNGIAEALHLDEFVLVVRNATGSGASNSVRITDLSFSMFT